ncbi:hypothetical protein AB0H76_29795 [Nocardia sp. NPDC050712]|uniref:hypothetical protein n=1 Tax=Nocardia sp. NPDC050712 TaxID=3155518 RepID=UPI0033FC7BEF
MNKIACGDCWRRDNLTFKQRLDPAYVRRGYLLLCDEHRASQEELRPWARFIPTSELPKTA